MRWSNIAKHSKMEDEDADDPKDNIEYTYIKISYWTSIITVSIYCFFIAALSKSSVIRIYRFRFTDLSSVASIITYISSNNSPSTTVTITFELYNTSAKCIPVHLGGCKSAWMFYYVSLNRFIRTHCSSFICTGCFINFNQTRRLSDK